MESYAAETPAELMREHLAAAFAPEAVRRELEHPESRFFLALHSGTPAGFAKLNTGAAQTEQPNEGGIEIESLYVLRRLHGLGIGRLLLDRALEEAGAAGAAYIWLGVWERNAAGRSFWARMGFAEYGSHRFDFAGTEHRDLLMRRELDRGADGR